MQNERDSDLTSAVNYPNLLFANVVDWYKSADLKAQVILTLDGALVAFLTTSIFKGPSEVSLLIQRFTTRTWLLLLAMCLCLVGSIISALMCLWSRIFLGVKRDSVLGREKKRITAGVKRYPPSVALFFKTISWLDHDKFQEQLLTTDAHRYIRMLSQPEKEGPHTSPAWRGLSFLHLYFTSRQSRSSPRRPDWVSPERRSAGNRRH